MFMWQKEAKIDISSLHLGGTPPVFNCIRALEQPPEGDDVVSLYGNGLDVTDCAWPAENVNRPVASSAFGFGIRYCCSGGLSSAN